MGRFLELFKPISRFIPEVSKPERRISFNAKLAWTGLALVIYLVMSEIPLYGVSLGPESAAMLTYRVIFASTRGTLMELGIGPIITAGLIIQLLAGAKMIEVDFSKQEDRALFTAASKVFSLLMIMLQSAIYIISGAFGTVTFGISVLIFLQLLASGIIIMLLDELLQKGWGMGSGISLFIVAGVAQRIWWDSLSLIPVGDGKRLGAIFAFFESIILGEPVWNWFHRPGGLPDMIGLITTITVFAVVIYFEGMRIELPVSHSTFRGYRGKMPIKLLYVSTIPVIFAYALFANVHLGSQMIWQRWNQDNSNFWLGLMGTYNRTEDGLVPTGGLAYYVTSPVGVEAISADPIRVIIYVLIVVSVCVLFSRIWVEVGGMGPERVAEQLIKSKMQVPGFRRSKGPIESLLKRYIPTITIIGGVLIGLISSVSELFGVFGSGMGALLCVSILYQFYQVIVQERIEDLYPFLRGALR